MADATREQKEFADHLDRLILFRGFFDADRDGGALASRLIALAERCGFDGDLWQAYLACALLRHENPWSLACEGRAEPDSSLSSLAARDMERILQAYRSGPPLVPELRDYRPAAPKSGAARVVEELRAALDAAQTGADAARALAEAYRRHGVGVFALHRAFRAEADGSLAPVSDTGEPLSALVGYEAQKAKLRANTEAFLAGRSANNVLLYGDAGTGKSTCVRALLAEYPDSLLRVIELPKDRLTALPLLADRLGRRGCRFLLFLDDLSFEEDETAYKQLKASIEGGLASLPENVRIYATSNRRHLVRETWKDRADMEHDADIHRSDTMEEKLSLSARFGLRIYYPSPTFQEYHAIVAELANRRGADGAALAQAASAWQVRQGSRSGRTAKQFVDDFLSKSDN
jgi:hypothetical protein